MLALPDSEKAKRILCSRVMRNAPRGFKKAEWSKVGYDDIERDQIAVELFNAIVEQRFPIFIHGPQGTGKSFLAACLYQTIAAHNCRWYLFDSLISLLAKARIESVVAVPWPDGTDVSWESEHTLKKKIANADFVVYDDVGTRMPSDTGYSSFKELIDLRFDMPTVYTSNFDLNELASDIFDKRIVDRISEGLILGLHGPSKRGANRRVVQIGAE